MIDVLSKNKIILDDKKKDNARSRLIINPDYKFEHVELDLLYHTINDIHTRFQKLIDANDDLVKDLINTIKSRLKR